MRTQSRVTTPQLFTSPETQPLATKLSPVAAFEEANVTIFQCLDRRESVRATRDLARSVLNAEKTVRFAGRVLQDAEGKLPMVYTENLFILFRPTLTALACESLLQEYGLSVKRPLGYATNSYFAAAPDGTGLKLFSLCQQLLDRDEVVLCHPELIKPISQRAIHANQWHLGDTRIGNQDISAHVNVSAAWQSTKGAGVVIAVIDDGVDVDHEEFSGNGKIVAPRDVTRQSDDPRPKVDSDNHGTACAGVACANGDHQASGVAPESSLMPIRLRSGLGSQAEADAFVWAADEGADVISCSWGPRDGRWWDPSDRQHQATVALPDSTRLAIDYAITQGRDGKGCVITWAAGNGRENVENDGYASYDSVIAVAACNDSGSRSVYSDFGASVWCAFPSNDFGHAPFMHPNALTPGIWTTDRAGSAGYNPGMLNPTATPPGDDHGHYSESFGGTSSACPGVAGVAALMLAINSQLTWRQVKNRLARACEQIDQAGGDYNAEGHSPFYGYGRINAGQAVQLAAEDAPHAASSPAEDIIPLLLSAEISGELSGSGDERLFRVEVCSECQIELDGPDNVDFDLYVRRDQPPTVSAFDQRAYTPLADEILKLTPSGAETHLILVRSYQGAGRFRLRVSQLPD